MDGTSRRGHLLLGLLMGALAAGCGDDGEQPPSESEDAIPEVRELFLGAPPVEGSQPPVLSARPEPSVTDVLARLEAARRDEDCRGVLLRLGPMGGAWGRVREIVE